MNTQYSLQPILQPANGKRVLATNSRQEFILDLDNNRVTRSRWGFNRKRLLVVNASDPTAVVEGTALTEVRDYESDGTPINLIIHYQTRCRPGEEQRLVERLGASEDPRLELERQLIFWTSDFVTRTRARFISDFRGQTKLLLADLRERAQRQLGLALRTRVRLAGQDTLSPLRLKVKGDAMRVRMEGHFEKYPLSMSMRLAVDTGNVLVAVQSQTQAARLRSTLIRTTKQYFEQHVTLHDFFFHLDGPITQRLHEHLQPAAGQWGRTVEGLFLNTREKLPKEIIEKTIAGVVVRQPLPDLDGDVEVKCSFLLQLIDTGRYFRAGKPDLDQWAIEATRKVTADVLFSTRYSELIRTYDDKKEEIKRRMVRRADTLGYAIRQLITITNLDLEDLQGSRFSVPPVEENFATRLVGVDAGLEVRADVRIIGMEKVAALLDRRHSVKAAMQSAIRDCVANKLHGVDPEEFYLYFELPRKKGKSLQQRLTAAIRKRLKEKFDAELLQIIFKATKTEITERLRELQSRSEKLVIEVEPRDGQLPATFEAIMVVSAVNPKGWQNFLLRLPTMEDVKETVRLALRYRLSEMSPQSLYHVLSEEMRPGISRWVEGRTSEDYGLAVKITDWWRRPTVAEKAATDNQVHLVEVRKELAQAEIDRVKKDFQEARTQHVKRRARLEAEANKIHKTLTGDRAYLLECEEEDALRRHLAEIEAELASVNSTRPDDALNALSSKLGKAALTGHGGLLAGNQRPYLTFDNQDAAGRSKRS